MLITMACPTSYRDKKEPFLWRLRIASNLANLRDKLMTHRIRIADPVVEVGSLPFALSYLGFENNSLLSTVSRIYSQVSPSLQFTAPHLRAHSLKFAPEDLLDKHGDLFMTTHKQGGRIRIGIVAENHANTSPGFSLSWSPLTVSCNF